MSIDCQFSSGFYPYSHKNLKFGTFMNLIKYCSIILFLSAFAAHAETSKDTVAKRLEGYKSVKLTTDLSTLTREQREGLKFLIMAAQKMDEAFYLQCYKEKSFLDSIKDAKLRKFAEINYGPWDR